MVDHGGDDLNLTLGLHVPAHDAEGQPGLSVTGREARDDGVEGPLARRIDIGVAVLKGEELAAVLEHEAQAIRDEARSHAAEVGLDEGDHQAVLVRGAKIGGVAVAGRLSGADVLQDAVRSDQGGASGGVVLGIEPGDRRLGEGGIGEEARPVLEGQPLGLGLVMQALGGHRTHGLHVEAFEDVQHLQGGQALGVRTQAEHLHATVGGAERRGPFALVVGQVAPVQPAPDAPEVALDPGRDFTFVKGVPAAVRDLAIGAAEVRVAVEIAFGRRLAAWRKERPHVQGLFDPGVAVQRPAHDIAAPDMGDGLGNGRAALAKRDGWLE